MRLTIEHGAESFVQVTETHLRIGECEQGGEWRINLISSKWLMKEGAKMKDIRKEHKCILLAKIVMDVERLKCNDTVQ